MKRLVVTVMLMLMAGCGDTETCGQEGDTCEDEPERIGSAAQPITCDVLSPFGVEDAACAIHCLMLGKSGGYCDEHAVCNCR